MNAAPSIAVRGLRRSFAGRDALRDVDFEVCPGEVTGLLGPNGAGKTTCLRILAGFVPPSAGSALVAGREVSAHSLEVRRRIGYLPEGAPLYPELRVEEHLTCHARLRGLSGDRRRAELERVIERCGLKEVRRRLGGQLSRGYRQRVGLAVALLGDPPVLLLDEPTSGLDPHQQREVRELIRELGRERTVLLSTHALPEVEAICARVLILRQGRLVSAALLTELREQFGGAGLEEIFLKLTGGEERA